MKQDDFQTADTDPCVTIVIRQREELAEQIRALKGMKEMAAIYGFDISEPAKMQKKHSSGCISDILQQSRLRTELP